MKKLLLVILLSSCGYPPVIKKLSQDYIECNESLHWNTGSINDALSIYNDEGDRIGISSLNQNIKIKNWIEKIPHERKFSKTELDICKQIRDRIIGQDLENSIHELKQYFSKEDFINAKLSAKKYAEIEQDSVELITTYYYHGLQKTSFIGSTYCPEKWVISKTVLDAYSFWQPQESCHFSVYDHELSLLGHRMKIAFHGSYEKDTEGSDEALKVNIERFGYRIISGTKAR